VGIFSKKKRNVDGNNEQIDKSVNGSEHNTANVLTESDKNLNDSFNSDRRALFNETDPKLFFEILEKLIKTLDELLKREKDSPPDDALVRFKDDNIRIFIDKCYEKTLPTYSSDTSQVDVDLGTRNFHEIGVHGEHFMSDEIKKYYEHNLKKLSKASIVANINNKGKTDKSQTLNDKYYILQRQQDELKEKHKRLAPEVKKQMNLANKHIEELNSLNPTLEAAKEAAEIINNTVDPIEFLNNIIILAGKFMTLLRLYKKHAQYYEGSPLKDLKRFVSNKDPMVRAFIDRYYDDSLCKIRGSNSRHNINIIVESFNQVQSSFETIFENDNTFKVLDFTPLLSYENKEHFSQKFISLEREANETLKKHNTHFDNMDGGEFEQFCANLLIKNGYINVQVTRGSGDHGVDILAETPNGSTYAIQCKRYSSSIGNKAVQEAYSGKTFYNRHIGVVMTNQYFTTAAIEAAEKTGVLLWDRNYLEKMTLSGVIYENDSFDVEGFYDDFY